MNIEHDWELIKKNFDNKINKTSLQLYNDYLESKIDFKTFAQFNKILCALADLNQAVYKDKVGLVYKYIVTETLDILLTPDLSINKYNDLRIKTFKQLSEELAGTDKH